MTPGVRWAYGPDDEELAGDGSMAGTIKAVQRRLTGATRGLDATPPPGTVTHPMLWPAAGAYEPLPGRLQDALAIDPVRLVSSHELSVVAGEPCIIGPATLYFEVSAADDAETLNATAGGYGWRAAADHNVDLYLRYHYGGDDGCNIGLARVTGETVQDIVVTGGDTWQQLTGDYLITRQRMTSTLDGIVVAAHFYMKRAAGVTGIISVGFWSAPVAGGMGFFGGPLGEIDVSALSTTGDWVVVPFSAAWGIANGQEVGISIENALGLDVSLYADTSSGYAGGVSEYYDLATSSWVASTTRDYYLKITTGGEAATNHAVPGYVPDGVYYGWLERVINLDMRCSHHFYDGENVADFYITLPTGLSMSAIGLLDTVTHAFPQWRAGHVRTRHIDLSPLPRRAVLFHDSSRVLAGNGLAATQDGSQRYSHWVIQSASANADSFTHSFVIQAGTYNFYALGVNHPAAAKIDWYLDDVVITVGQDWYADPAVYNTVKTVSSVVIAASGYHVLKGVINGRNAGNTTAYNMFLTTMRFLPTVAD